MDFQKISSDKPLKDNGKEIVAKRRARYLEQKLLADLDNPFFVLFDETWIHDGMGSENDWQFGNPTEYQIVSSEHPIPGPFKAKHRGKRGIVLASLTELLQGSVKFIISGAKPEEQMADYHQEMYGETYDRCMRAMIPLIAIAAAVKGRNP
ncbi:unnamed protein product [Caenorhabditis sp. 36 PRJEB53466]|nr:unnamed protein product [Caenorhabditis sp. 36 PRJEB53466]